MMGKATFFKGDKMKKYEIFNVNCNHCVNKIKNALEEDFGTINFSDDLKYIFINANKKEFEDELLELGFRLGKLV